MKSFVNPWYDARNKTSPRTFDISEGSIGCSIGSHGLIDFYAYQRTVIAVNGNKVVGQYCSFSDAIRAFGHSAADVQGHWLANLEVGSRVEFKGNTFVKVGPNPRPACFVNVWSGKVVFAADLIDAERPPREEDCPIPSEFLD